MSAGNLPPLLLLLALACGACEAERYFGPYPLEAPTPLAERTAARTFELPLSGSDQAELVALTDCLAGQPDRDPPCACDLPVQTVAALDLRVDYTLAHLSGEAASVEVWIGDEAPAGEPDPAVLPDRPRVDVFAFHLHRLSPGASLSHSFSEAELEAADLAWSLARHPLCEPADAGARPSPLSWLLGVSLTGEEPARVKLEFTVRVRGGG